VGIFVRLDALSGNSNRNDCASSVGFSRYLGVLWPQIAETNYIIRPIHVLPTYALSLSTAQLVALLVITFLTWTNINGLKYGKGVQNVFTSMKIGSLLGVIGIGVLIGCKAAVVRANFAHAWTPQGSITRARLPTLQRPRPAHPHPCPRQ